MKAISDLLNIPFDERNEDWHQLLFHQIPHSTIELLSEEAQTGPDHWPYLFANLTVEKGEPTQKVLAWLSEKGIGLVINPEIPDCVLSYGMIWNLRETGHLQSITDAQKPPINIELSENTKVLAGPPTEEYLPAYVRKILNQFFLDQGLLRPQILILSEDKEHYDLCFSLESLGNPPKAEHASILEAFSWFFPRHYSLALISEQGLPKFSNLQ